MKMNRVLLVTGASSDFGCALLKRISGNYSAVIAHYAHNKDRLEEIAGNSGTKMILVQDDFSKPEAGSSILAAIRENALVVTDVVHLPAPGFVNEKFHKSDSSGFVNGFNVSVLSISNILKPVIAAMVKNKIQGKIVFMLTSYVNNIPPKFMSSYITTKYALLGLMKSLSADYADKSIMVNAVSPGMTETKFLGSLPDFYIEQQASTSVFGRNLAVDDVIPAFEYLLSDGASLVTGVNLPVTGGN